LKKLIIIYLGIIAIITLIILYFSSDGRKVQPERISGAYKALNFFSEQRAYPYSAIPDISHYAAFEKQRSGLKKTRKFTEKADPWETIGPLNTAGRTLVIAFNPQNPQTMYAGSASGGLWRSHTSGVGVAAWEYIPTGFPVLAVSSVAVSPNDSNIIYIGTGEVYNYQQAGTGAAYRSTRGSYGIGILKSIDGGNNWTKSLDWSYHQKRGVEVVRINPLNPNTIWAGTTEGTFKSVNAGLTWQQMNDIIMVWDLVINPIDTNIVIISCGNFSSAGHGVYRTTDGGASWDKTTAGLPVTFAGKAHLAIYQKSPNIVFVSIGNGFSSSNGASWLCKSEDSGATWTILSTQDYSMWQGWFSHDVGVNPIDSSQVIAVGIGAWKSTTGGSNLVLKSTGSLTLGRPPIGAPDGPPNYIHADIHDVVYHPENPNTVYYATDGGIFRSLDGGETFQSINGGYQTVQFYNGFSSSHQDSLLAMGGLQDNSTIIYDGQLAWIRVIGGDGSWTAIDQSNENVMYASWQNLNLLKSANKGNSWFDIPVPSSFPTSFIAPYVLAADNPQVLYAGRAIIYKSINGGESWVATNNGNSLDGNPAIAMAVSQQNSDIVYVATAPFNTRGGIFRTLDGGNNWSNITGILPDRFPADICVDATDDATVYITFSGFGEPHIFKSQNFGDTWENIQNGLPDVPTSAVIVDPTISDHIYVGNDLGVFVSADGGSSWMDYNEGLPDAVMVFDLKISPLNQKIRVATHGNGAYQRELLKLSSGISDNGELITTFKLEQNYPNPFNSSTTINYNIYQATRIRLKIYDSLGREIKTLIDNEFKNAGVYSSTWQGIDADGKPVASGTYIYRLSMKDKVISRRMTLVR
jgi:photosystem II stability/assembly factor-like uncharacterized protein